MADAERSLRDAILRAKSLYQRQNYRLALEILDSNAHPGAIARLSTSDQFVVYELLAALHERTGSIHKAHKYATYMVRLRERDPRGYLRLGKILQGVPGKLGDAVKIYQRALVKLSKAEPTHRALIEKQMTACMALNRDNLLPSGASAQALTRSGLGVRQDFVAYFPREISVFIFASFSLRELAKCCLVSRRWRDFITSETSFWSDLNFSSTAPAAGRSSNLDGKAPEKPAVIPAKTLIRYCGRSSTSRSLSIDLSQVVLKDPQAALVGISKEQRFSSRIRQLKVNSRAHTVSQPTIRMLRGPGSMPFSSLTELSILSDSPDSDVRWCIANLPALKVLEIVTLPRHKPPRHAALEAYECKGLHTLLIWGQSNSRVLTDSMATEIAGLPSIRSLDMHRVVPRFWPTMRSAVANPEVTRLGFTAEGIQARNYLGPLPQFSGKLKSITLNELAFSSAMPALLPDGTRWSSATSFEATRFLEYIELKRVHFEEFTLAGLLYEWGCDKTLETLVLHSTTFHGRMRLPRPEDATFAVFERLSVLQFTNMQTLTDDTFQWIIAAFPNLQKVNFDGTAITGPKLVRLLRAGVRAVRCKSITDMSADTIAWIGQLHGVSVVF